MNMLIFKGIGSDDPEYLWFVTNVVWIAQQITDDNIKKDQLVTTLQDRALTWYIKYCANNPHASLAETQTTFNKEFGKPKSEAQSLIEFKEIMMKVEETTWDFDQRLKFQIRQSNMQVSDR